MYLPQSAITSNNNTTSTPKTILIPAPTTGYAALNKHSPPLDFRSTVSNLSAQYPTATIVDFPRNNPTPDANKNLADTTEEFKTIISGITEDLLFLITPMSYGPKTVPLQPEDLEKELIDTDATYKSYVPHPKIIPYACD